MFDIKVVYYIFFFISLIALLKMERNFIVILPVFNVILDSSFSFFPSLSVVTYFRPVIYLILILYFARDIKVNGLNRQMFIFLAYTFILVIFSSEFFYSLKGYGQVFISMMMIVLGFIYFDTQDKLHTLNRSLLFVLLFSVISSALGYAFDIGRTLEYSTEETIGILGSGGLYSAAFAIGLLPLLIRSFNKPLWRYLLLVSSVAAYIFILLNVRRTAIIIPLVGLISFSIFIPGKSKVITGLIIGVLVFIILSPIYADTLLRRFELREEKGRFDKNFYQTEARYIENIEVYSNAFSFREPLKSLFGSGIFASGRVGGEIGTRMLHTDIANLVGGTGIIGLIIYVIFYLKLFGYIYYLKLPVSQQLHLYKSSYYSVFLISLFVALNGSLMLVSLRTLIFLYLGASLSLLYRRVGEVGRRHTYSEKIAYFAEDRKMKTHSDLF